MTTQSLEFFLKKQSPIAEALGVSNFIISDSSLSLELSSLSLELPLLPNRNHKNTLFGGSLYSAGALACYALFLTGLRSEQVPTENIVISHGEMSYLAPVDRNAIVTASWSSEAEKEHFFKTLHLKNKARTQMNAQICIAQKICAEFKGQFVAKL